MLVGNMKMRHNLLKTHNNGIRECFFAFSRLFCDGAYCFIPAASTFCIFSPLWKVFLANSTVNMERYCSPEQLLLPRYSKVFPKILFNIFQGIPRHSKHAKVFWNILRYCWPQQNGAPWLEVFFRDGLALVVHSSQLGNCKILI